MKYAVWLHVEETDESIGYFKDIVAPICISVLDSRAEAEAFARKMAGGIPPKLSSRLLRVCKRVEHVFRKFGETTGFGLAGPACWAAIEELHEAVAEAEQT